MDGIEWAREKWSWYERAWLYANEMAACRIGNQLIADHPEIARLLGRKVSASKILTIPYGAPAVDPASTQPLEAFGLKPDGYSLVVARAEPENSILEIVRAYVQNSRSVPLIVLGNYHPAEKKYHQLVMQAANGQIQFLGAIFDQKIVSALRFHARLYLHGHRVGGTNPSLVESIAAGNAVLAKGRNADPGSPFTRLWTAAIYTDKARSVG